jgi:hypothetical protein
MQQTRDTLLVPVVCFALPSLSVWWGQSGVCVCACVRVCVCGGGEGSGVQRSDFGGDRPYLSVPLW